MSRTLDKWDPENEAEWNSTGKGSANRNLWISIPNLLCAFSVWLYWGMVAKFIQKLHFANTDLFNFTFRNDGEFYDGDGYRALLFTLPAVAGLAGATLRIPNSFMIAICGGRNVKFMTTMLLILPGDWSGHRSAKSQTRRSLRFIHPRSSVGRWRRRVFLVDVEHQLLFSKAHARASLWDSMQVSATLGVSVMQFLLARGSSPLVRSVPWAVTPTRLLRMTG